jgi:hypothetical protein
MIKTTRHGGHELDWMRGTGNKKYKVTIYFKNGTKKTIQFGDKRYQQYKDSTPLKLYKTKDHKDKSRRENYRKRHGARGYQKKKYSPAWFSWNYLW